MSKPSSADALAKIIEQLQPLDGIERDRVIRAVRTFFQSDSQVEDDGDLDAAKPDHAIKRKPATGAKEYFDQKKPANKMEEIAVAARFREEFQNVEASTRDELKAIFAAARRTFDAHNFNRDTNNARTKGYFMRGTGRDSFQLASYGQNFVDALPDREAAKSLAKKSGRRCGRKKADKKA